MGLPVIDPDRVKEHLNVAHDLDDDLIALLTQAAVERTVQEIGLAGCLVEQVTVLPSRNLAFLYPVESVSKVEGWDGSVWADLETVDWTLSGSFDAGHRIDVTGTWTMVRVTWEAGFEEVPAWFTVAALFLIGHWYENRSSVIVGQGVAAMEVPMGFTFLTQPHRRILFA